MMFLLFQTLGKKTLHVATIVEEVNQDTLYERVNKLLLLLLNK